MTCGNQGRYGEWGRKLEEHFGDWKSRVREWSEVKRKPQVGQPVEGIVIARAPFGAWLDIGIGFPALIEITQISGLEPVVYQAGNWAREGSDLSANLLGMDDSFMAVSLTQQSSGFPASLQICGKTGRSTP